MGDIDIFFKYMKKLYYIQYPQRYSQGFDMVKGKNVVFKRMGLCRKPYDPIYEERKSGLQVNRQKRTKKIEFVALTHRGNGINSPVNPPVFCESGFSVSTALPGCWRMVPAYRVHRPAPRDRRGIQKDFRRSRH